MRTYFLTFIAIFALGCSTNSSDKVGETEIVKPEIVLINSSDSLTVFHLDTQNRDSVSLPEVFLQHKSRTFPILVDEETGIAEIRFRRKISEDFKFTGYIIYNRSNSNERTVEFSYPTDSSK